MKTLDGFLSTEILYSKSEYVKHPDFKSLYVRRGIWYFEGEKFEKVITIASIEAKKKGEGAFTRLIKYLFEKYKCPIQVECVHFERFQNHLIRNGFTKINKSTPGDYYKLYDNK